MIPGAERRSFLMSITLTELVLLMFFLLLLLAGLRIGELIAETRDVRRENDTLREVLGQQDRQTLDLIDACSEEGMMEVEARRTEREIQIAQARLDSLQQESDSLRSELREAALAQGALATADTAGDDFKELVSDLAAAGAVQRLQKVEDENRGLRARCNDAARLADSLAVLAQKNRDLAAQLTRMVERAEESGRGLGFPPCWPAPDGTPEYIFEVALDEEAFSVRPAWPDYRESQGDLDRVTDARELVADGLTSAEFRRRAAPILAWSKGQNPECRHFVRINDSAQMSKEAFKSKLLTVEDFFYKYLPGS